MIPITEEDMAKISIEHKEKKPETLIELIPRPYVGMNPIRTTSNNQIMFTGTQGDRWNFIGRHIPGEPAISLYITNSGAKVTREGLLTELDFERLITQEDSEHAKYDAMLRNRKIEY